MNQYTEDVPYNIITELAGATAFMNRTMSSIWPWVNTP